MCIALLILRMHYNCLIKCLREISKKYKKTDKAFLDSQSGLFGHFEAMEQIHRGKKRQKAIIVDHISLPNNKF